MNSLWIKAIYTLGFSTVVAAGLIYWLVTSIDLRVQNIQTTLQAHQLDTSYIIKYTQEQGINQRAMYNLLQQICINTARTAEDRSNCWNPWGK